MFKEDREELRFDWAMLGDLEVGRPNLGRTMNVAVYRLMQFTMRDVMIMKFGAKAANEVVYQAGRSAGSHFFRHLITETTDFNGFLAQLQRLLLELGIGILRLEEADLESMHFIITVAEDLDCSGLPVNNETICTYDEGFINGLMEEFTGREFDVREIDCWCSGDRVCRFEVKPRA